MMIVSFCMAILFAVVCIGQALTKDKLLKEKYFLLIMSLAFLAVSILIALKGVG